MMNAGVAASPSELPSLTWSFMISVMASLSPILVKRGLVEPQSARHVERASAVGGAALRIDLAVKVIELCGRAELRHRKLDAARHDRGDAEHREGHEHEAKFLVDADHVGDVGRGDPAKRTVEIVELDQRRLAVRIGGDHHAGQTVDRLDDCNAVIGNALAIVAGERKFGNRLHRPVAGLRQGDGDAEQKRDRKRGWMES